MDLRDQLKNIFPDHEEQDFEMPVEKFVQKEPLTCKFEKKGRHGKPVTLIEGFEGSDAELKSIAKKIKVIERDQHQRRAAIVAEQLSSDQRMLHRFIASCFKSCRRSGRFWKKRFAQPKDIERRNAVHP